MPTRNNQTLHNHLKLDALREDERVRFYAEMGGVIFEAALTRLIGSLDENSLSALEHYLETEPEPNMLIAHLMHNYPDFNTFLMEEMAGVQEEVHAIMPAT